MVPRFRVILREPQSELVRARRFDDRDEDDDPDDIEEHNFRIGALDPEESFAAIRAAFAAFTSSVSSKAATSKESSKIRAA